jgi:hypothetical protein
VAPRITARGHPQRNDKLTPQYQAHLRQQLEVVFELTNTTPDKPKNRS